MPLRSTTATDLAMAFLVHWIYLYGLHVYVLTDSGPQFVAKLFEHLCSDLGLKHLFTTAYHQQNNGKVERFNRTLASRVSRYDTEHQLDWDAYVQTLVHAYIIKVRLSTGTTSFDLTFIQAPAPYMVDLQDSSIPQDITREMMSAQAERYSR